MRKLITLLLGLIAISSYATCPGHCDYTNPATFPGTLTLNSGDTLCITQNYSTTWTSIAVQNGGVVLICNGANFTVNGSMAVSPGGKVIIADCGSKLRIVGSYSGIYNQCEIYVYCDSCGKNGYRPYQLVSGSDAWADWCCMTPLPVELLYFEIEVKSDVTTLRWSTASEINNDYFSIEKSYDATNWTEVSRVQGNNGNQIREYAIFDKREFAYYRLKQVDFDGTQTYSKIVASSSKNELNATELYRVNALGEIVDNDFKGLVFIIYNNGQILKTIQF